MPVAAGTLAVVGSRRGLADSRAAVVDKLPVVAVVGSRLAVRDHCILEGAGPSGHLEKGYK